MSEWMTKAEAAAHLVLSVDTIERRGIPWQEDPVQFKIRVKYLCLGEGTRELPRYFRADVDALLATPKPGAAARTRTLFERDRFNGHYQ